MIQRIQTVFLGFVMICLGAFCFMPIWEKVNDKTADKIILNSRALIYYNASVNEDNQLSNISVAESALIYLVVLAGIIAAIALVSIFSFKNRVRQMKLGFVNTLLIVILISLVYYQILEADKILVHPHYGDYKVGFFLPILALISNVLANVYIKKDEDLVRSADRLR